MKFNLTTIALLGCTQAMRLNHGHFTLNQQEAKLEIQSVGDQLETLKSKIAEADALSKSVQDETQRKAVLDYLHALYPPYHDMIHHWEDWFYAGNHPDIPPYMFPKKWQPEYSYTDMVAQEVNDV